MTHRSDNKAFDQVLEVLIENGLDGMVTAMEVVFNEAMKWPDEERIYRKYVV